MKSLEDSTSRRKRLGRKLAIQLSLLAATFIAIVVIPAIGTQILDKWLGIDISGWLQAGVALISFPVIIYELNELRKTATLKPQIEVGLANMLDIHHSRVRGQNALPDEVSVDAGYAHFYIVWRNHGQISARYMKVRVEHVNRFEDDSPAMVEVSEFSETKPTFFHEHNFEFVFKGANDWIIHPDDMELFGFHITTRIMMTETDSDGKEHTLPVYPPPCRVALVCAVWAEGLENPERRNLTVNIVERLDNSSNV